MLEGISKKVINTNDCIKICLWFPKVLLSLVCIWPGQMNNAVQRFSFWIIIAICTFIKYGLYNFIAENFQDFNESFTGITLISTVMQVTVKGSVFYYFINTAKGIVKVILYKFWPADLITKEVEDSLKKYYHILLIGMMSIYFNGVFYSLTFISAPLFKEAKETPYKTVYPFDYGKSPKFELMYLIQVIMNFHLVLGVIVGVDTLFMAICCNMTAQYRLLKNAISKLGTDEVRELNAKLSLLYEGADARERNVTDEEMFLSRCIEHHQLLLRTMDEVEKLYGIIGFFQLGFSIIAICLSSFVLTREDVAFNQLVNIAMYMSGHIVQLFLYCSVATELDFEMDDMSQYIFSSCWYQTNFVQLKQDILFVIRKSQKVKKITALKLFPLNYETFIQVLRLSFSFHTLLSNITVK